MQRSVNPPVPHYTHLFQPISALPGGSGECHKKGEGEHKEEREAEVEEKGEADEADEEKGEAVDTEVSARVCWYLLHGLVGSCRCDCYWLSSLGQDKPKRSTACTLFCYVLVFKKTECCKHS